MRLVSVKVRNYRVHRELEVHFDRHRTVIGGPNEAGKSTLVEAIHRTLFLKAKGNTEFHRAMQSHAAGNPEVDLTFEAGGASYTVKKRFGANGGTALVPAGGQLLSGDEAEQKLAAILAVDAAAGKAVLQQWAHLWVWQGKSCEDPSGHATNLKSDLVQRLQSMGAAAVLQSERDSRVAAQIRAKFEEIYTASGKVKAGCELDVAEKATAEARQRRNVAAGKFEALEAAAARLDAARSELPQIEGNLREAELEQTGIEERSVRLAELQRQHLEAVHQASDAAKELESRASAQERILKLQKAIKQEEEALAPLQKEVASLTQSTAALRGVAAKAQTAYEAATDQLRIADQQRTLADEQHRRFLLRQEKAALEERSKRLTAFREGLTGLEEKRSKLPELTAATVKKLQKLELECEKARQAIKSIATGVQLLETKSKVTLDGRALAAGETEVISEDAVIATSDGTRIHISPGGGAQLAEARKELATHERELDDLLAKFALDSAAQAADLIAQRNQLNSEIEKVQAQIEELNPDDLAGKLAQTEESIRTADATIARLRAKLPASEDPMDEATGRMALKHAFEALERAESLEKMGKVTRDTSLKQAAETEDSLAKTQAKFNEQNHVLDQKRAELRVLVETHGGEEQRFSGIRTAESALQARQEAVQRLQTAIQELQPDLLELDRQRVKRRIEQARDRKNSLGKEIAGAQAMLHSEGVDDPQAALAMAEVRLRAAEERLARAQRDAKAVELLHRYFQEEQQALSEQFTRPLADKISGYLKCLFGESARASIDLNEHGFTGLTITRDGVVGGFKFEALSGGTQEQTAAAVRLAMAEVLAADHEGCLPIVFDDAFVYADPDRVKRLQRMLDHAAVSGLQVIVLTCNPQDYAALGAHYIALPLCTSESQTRTNAPMT